MTGPDSEIEGEDDSKASGWGQYPLDSVFVRTEPRTVGDVVKRIIAGRYQLDPEFQRDFVWAIDKQSKLIESCLMRIPLPVFYVAEAKDGRIVVVDGLQRLTTFQRYLSNDFAITGLGDDHEMKGKRFSDLPIALQERLEDTPLIFYILDAKAPERARLDIFDRVNGGVPLSRQQMRNCLYNGNATQWLKQASDSGAFLRATDRSLDRKSMRDREAINRFCAFKLLGAKEYTAGDMDGFLAQTLERMNSIDDQARADLMLAFERSMSANFRLFGKHAFRKSLAANVHSARTIVNIALFDVCSVLLTDFPEDATDNQVNDMRIAFKLLLEDAEFKYAIGYSTNSTRQVNKRFSLAEQAISIADLI